MYGEKIFTHCLLFVSILSGIFYSYLTQLEDGWLSEDGLDDADKLRKIPRGRKWQR